MGCFHGKCRSCCRGGFLGAHGVLLPLQGNGSVRRRGPAAGCRAATDDSHVAWGVSTEKAFGRMVVGATDAVSQGAWGIAMDFRPSASAFRAFARSRLLSSSSALSPHCHPWRRPRTHGFFQQASSEASIFGILTAHGVLLAGNTCRDRQLCVTACRKHAEKMDIGDIVHDLCIIPLDFRANGRIVVEQFS